MDVVNIIAAIILGLFAAWLTWYTYIRSRKDNRLLAIESGDLDKSKPTIYLFGHPLKNGKKYSLTMGMHYSKFEKLVYNFPLQIKNDGKKSLKNITAIFFYARESILPVEDDFVKVSSFMHDDFFKRKYSKNAHGTHVTFSIQQLNPQLTAEIGDLIKLEKTDVFFDHEVTTLDKIRARVKYKLTTVHVFSVVVTAEDHVPITVKFEISLPNSEGYNDFCNDYLNEIQTGLSKNDVHEVSTAYFCIQPDIEFLQQLDEMTVHIVKSVKGAQILALEPIISN